MTIDNVFAILKKDGTIPKQSFQESNWIDEPNSCKPHKLDAVFNGACGAGACGACGACGGACGHGTYR